ncbi:MAG: branched-chain amino acid transport system substrate-binding protein [Chloroflexota bacterium]|nr:branched-chain amino acid transport system substrate-binding protein [Chloroflexota bacterium]
MRSGRVVAPVVTLLLAACAPFPIGGGGASSDLPIGVLLPLSGPQASLAQEELNGIQAAVDDVNAHGGVHGRRVTLVTRDVTTREAAAGAVVGLKDAGARVLMGTYSTALSIPAAHATAAAGLVYWETGAVADQVTGDALPRVFRVGAAGANLGRGSATFAAEQVAPRLGKAPPDLRVSVVQEHDAYGDSVAGAAIAEARARGIQLAPTIDYDARSPDWDRVLGAVRTQAPDVLVLASYIPDGVAFRRAMLAADLKVGALIGSTMAECGPEFGQSLGADAKTPIASDRPTRGFNPAVLSPDAAAAYSVLLRHYHEQLHREPGEEAISGFSSAWALLVHTLPAARDLEPDGIAAAAQAQDLPEGSLPNGGGLRFSDSSSDRGQNLRAASVIWQWQGVEKSVTVWPRVFATGDVQMVPLPR